MVRGIAMVIMALDHSRDFIHIGANTDDPLNLATTTPLLFFTRWVTHFCAPIFVFLSGTSVYLQSLRKTRKELGAFLIKRGLWLVFAELFIISLAWTFNPMYNVLPFQVIWAIGISMVILGILILLRFSYTALLITGLVIVAGHNLLDIPESAPGFTAGFWWDFLHHGSFVAYPLTGNHYMFMVYPFPAWTGVMLLGYCAGRLYTANYSAARRQKVLVYLGTGLVLFFVLLRFTNAYGDPHDWSTQRSGFYTFLSFITVHKYPPSLLYLCIMIGPALLLLAWLENLDNRFTATMVIFGRTAFAYYILHIMLIHLVATVLFFARGHSFADAAEVGKNFPFLFVAPGEGYGLGMVYLVWIGVVVALYPFCRWYNAYKSQHRDKWWLSYL